MRRPVKISLVLVALWFAAQPSLPAADVPRKKTASAPLSMFAIPKELGTVESRYKGKGARTIVHIQDIHGHVGAQENIAAIIDQLNTVYGIRKVAVEGGWSRTTFKKSWGLPASREKHTLARGLLDEAQITGAAYSALFAPLPMKLAGIEDPSVYEENRGAFLENIGQREAVQTKIMEWENKLLLEKSQVFNEALNAFYNQLSDYRDGKKVDKFLPALVETAETQKIDLSGYGQVLTLKKILELEKSLDEEKLKKESTRLVKEYRKKRLNFEELLRSGRIPDEKLAFYPALQQYMQIIKLQDTIQHRLFFKQIEDTINEVKETLFETQEERDLDKKMERFFIARRILLLGAAGEDLKAYTLVSEALAPEIEAAGLKDVFELSRRFYALAKKRDGIFFDKITESKVFSGNLVVVAGGFHTDGLTERLEGQGISYIVITPSLGETMPNEELYFKRMLDPIVHQQALSDTQDRFLTKAFDAGFAAALLELKLSKDVNKAVGVVVDYMQGRGGIATGKTQGEKASDFLALSPQEQKAKVREWVEKAKQAKLAVSLAAKTPVLAELFKSELGLALFREFVAPERANTLFELRGEADDYLEPLIGTEAQVIRIRTAEVPDLSALLQRRFQDPKKKEALAVIDPEFKADDVLVLPQEPAAFLLARLMLEGAVEKTADAAFVKKVGEILAELLTEGLFGQSA